MLLQNNELKELLLTSKTLTEKDVAELSVFARNSQLNLAEALIEKGVMSDGRLGKLVAESLKLPFIELSKMIIPETIFYIIPERLARKYKIIAFAQGDRTISLGTANPYQKDIIDMVVKKTSKKPLLYYATEVDIDNTLQMYRKDLQEVVDNFIEEELGSTNTLTNDAPIIKIVDMLITYAYREKASDIHIEPEENNLLVRFRVDSILHDVLVLDKNLHSSIVTRLKVLANLRTDEHLDAQDGRMRMKVDNETLDIRVSVIPTTEGEKIVLRLLSSKFRSFSLADLGMNPLDLRKVYNAINKSYGMILSTGPTGSGKTTSIYALLKILNTREKNIMTIEDPVEYHIKGVNHIQVNAKSALSFANGLRSILRQDPNVIFVGEIRDGETAGLAVNAALTGHLVLSTLHTNDAATTLPRLIDLQVEPFLIASTVNVIIAQRLVRKICTVCKTAISMEKSAFAKDILESTLTMYFGKKKTIDVSIGKGCKVCHYTGYVGRIGIFEVIEMTEKIRSLIVKKEDATTIRKAAIADGMVPMLEDGLAKVATGTTTMDEVLRVIKTESV